MITDPRVSATIVLYHASPSVLETVKSIVNSEEQIQLYVVENSDRPVIQRLKRHFRRKQAEPVQKKSLQPGHSRKPGRLPPQSSPVLRMIENIDPSTLFCLEDQNLGYGRGHNEVIPYLKSTYHMIVNPDITFDSGLVSRMVDYMDQHPDIVMLSPRVFFPDGTEQHLPHRRPTVRYLLGGPFEHVSERFAAWRDRQIEKHLRVIDPPDSEDGTQKPKPGFHPFRKMAVGMLSRMDLPFKKWRDEYTLRNENISEPIHVEFATGCFMMIRTHTLYQMKGFDPRYFLYQEDSDITLKALNYGHVVYHPDMHVTHAWSRADAKSLRLRLVHVYSTLQFFWKWGWRW